MICGNEDTAQRTTYEYDTCSGGNCGLYLWGRLSRIVYGNGMVETHSYTTAGLLAWKDFLPAANLEFGLKTEYSWDNEGRMTQMKYPMTGTANGQGWYNEVPGSVLAYSYDAAGRMTGMTRDGGPVVSNATWNAAGQPLTMGAYSFSYNVRGQMLTENGPNTSLSYTYSATANDGRVQRRDRTGLSSESVEYQYDELGRLISAATTGPEWDLSWTFDGLGNRLSQNVTKGSGPMVNLTVDAATNRITTYGFAFHANGNMTQWPQGGNTIRGTLSGTDRIPDFWNLATNTIYEVKNESSLSYTEQIRDMAEWAKRTPGASFQLWVRRGASLSGELQKAVDEGLIQLHWFTWP